MPQKPKKKKKKQDETRLINSSKFNKFPKKPIFKPKKMIKNMNFKKPSNKNQQQPQNSK